MGQILTLESFDTGTPPPPDAAPAPLAYEDGFATGREAGLAQARAERTQLDNAVVQRLTELAFTHAEARQQVLESLRPLFVSIAGLLLPGLARASLGAFVVEALMEAAEGDSRTPIALLVAPDSLEALGEIVAAQPGLAVQIEANPALGPGEVLLRTPERETVLDLDRLVADIAAALDALVHDPPDARSALHG
ncbi:putative flagellar biosynthesis/type III secretory pathway protein [Oceanicola granulosus HTCC2516]|uniref:Putative flagellar biosynthesis/type III secretory pathway protein n=1 Tax=Oceanicola granulosus (strain ATCC BAA-861 / DSM 15982 / KCTC 12143 / HTCC2516) TaxID=314256 RepID=Q2CDJ1_OCEGH|nr:hypothetical protein [Oceanicola granulosus]EAR50720.1 putative flagellar biosynthesis/type III secretory pathway protein [Oceanicola granulosus HTCC2516]